MAPHFTDPSFVGDTGTPPVGFDQAEPKKETLQDVLVELTAGEVDVADDAPYNGLIQRGLQGLQGDIQSDERYSQKCEETIVWGRTGSGSPYIAIPEVIRSSGSAMRYEIYVRDGKEFRHKSVYIEYIDFSNPQAASLQLSQRLSEEHRNLSEPKRLAMLGQCSSKEMRNHGLSSGYTFNQVKDSVIKLNRLGINIKQVELEETDEPSLEKVIELLSASGPQTFEGVPDDERIAYLEAEARLMEHLKFLGRYTSAYPEMKGKHLPEKTVHCGLDSSNEPYVMIPIVIPEDSDPITRIGSVKYVCFRRRADGCILPTYVKVEYDLQDPEAGSDDVRDQLNKLLGRNLEAKLAITLLAKETPIDAMFGAWLIKHMSTLANQGLNLRASKLSINR